MLFKKQYVYFIPFYIKVREYKYIQFENTGTVCYKDLNIWSICYSYISLTNNNQSIHLYSKCITNIIHHWILSNQSNLN